MSRVGNLITSVKLITRFYYSIFNFIELIIFQDKRVGFVFNKKKNNKKI
jgi:hypothetical protein